MLKYTSKSSVDYKFLEQAIITLQDVLVHINEAKRKIESQVALFEIFNKIDHCPVGIAIHFRDELCFKTMLNILCSYFRLI